MELVTQHASIRMQQRGIGEKRLDCLLKFGSKMHSKKGCFIMFFDKQVRKRLQKIADSNLYKYLLSHLDTYAIVTAQGEVLTVGHRFKRINRN